MPAHPSAVPAPPPRSAVPVDLESRLQTVASRIRDLHMARSSGSLTIHFSGGVPSKVEVRTFEGFNDG
jgi:hypothetical protein